MLTCVMGLPAAAYTGLALMSTVDFDAAAEAWSALGAATLAVLVDARDASSFLIGAAFTGVSVDVERWGMFRISLYLACLSMKLSVPVPSWPRAVRIVAEAHARWRGGLGAVFALRDDVYVLSERVSAQFRCNKEPGDAYRIVLVLVHCAALVFLLSLLELVRLGRCNLGLLILEFGLLGFVDVVALVHLHLVFGHGVSL